MKRRRHGLWIASCWLAVGLVRAQSETPVTLDIGVDVAGPGDQVFLPVTFSNSGAGRVGKISFEVSFPRKWLSFREAAPAAGIKQSELEIKTELATAERGGDEIVLGVQVTSSTPLPEGDLLKLSFDISKDAKMNDEIAVKNLRQSAQSLQGEALGARGASGMVTVLKGAFFACFFYMH